MAAETPAAVPTADFGTRFSAFMIDALVLFAAQWIIFIVLSRQLQAVGLTSNEPCVANSIAACEGPSTLLWGLLLVVLVVSTIGYHAICEGLYQATPGKHWMGLAVVGADGFGPIGLSAGVLRAVVRQGFWLSLLFVFDASPLGLGLPSILFVGLPLFALGTFVVGAFSPDGRAVHDLAANTYVVRADQLPAPDKAGGLTTPIAAQPPQKQPSGDIVADPQDSEEPV